MAKLEILKAAVYCGTYGKYNAGSIDGAWMQLAKYQTNEEFLEACARLHKDEHDPEFMYQDMEYLPDEFYSESWIDPEVFQVLATVKPWDEVKQSAFAAFLDEKGWPPDIFSIEEFLAAQASGKRANIRHDNRQKQSALKELLEITKKHGEDCDGYYVGAIKIKDGYFTKFKKQELQKSFCFGYSDFGQGMTEEEANETCANFGAKEFKEYNLSKFDRMYEDELEQLGRYKDVTLRCTERTDHAYTVCEVQDKFTTPDPEHELTLEGEEADRFREEYKTTVASLRADFEKKINSYLKRYGVSKIRKWTYWADE